MGDALGYRVTVTAPIRVNRHGIRNADTAAGGLGLSSPHQVGIWNSMQSLIASVTVDPATGTRIGDWTYAAIEPVPKMLESIVRAGVPLSLQSCAFGALPHHGVPNRPGGQNLRARRRSS